MPCAPKCTIELRFSATDLANKDFLSLSDPFLVCHTVRNGLPAKKLGKTETVQDDLNPVWATTISFDYLPSDSPSSAILVDIFDRDSHDSDALSKHDFLGRAVFRLPKLLDAPHARLDLDLRPARNLLIPPPTYTMSTLTDTPDDDDDDDDDDADENDLRSRGTAPYPGDDAETIDSDNSTWYSPSSTLRKHFFSGPPRDTESSVSSSAPRTLRSTPSYTNSRAGGGSGALGSAPRPSAATMDLMRATTSSRATKKVRGTLSVYAETLASTKGMGVVFRVHSALLRDACTLGTPFGRRITQFYEIQRERAEGAHTTWSCVWRSRDGVTVDKNNYVQFEDVRLDERTLNNMKKERKLRIAFYRRHTRSQHELISYVTTSLADLLAPRFRDADVVLRMEGQFADDNDLGNVLVRRFDRWVAEGRAASVERTPSREEVRIELRADHFLHKKYVSSLNDEPSGQVRRLRQRPAFFTLH